MPTVGRNTRRSLGAPLQVVAIALITAVAPAAGATPVAIAGQGVGAIALHHIEGRIRHELRSSSSVRGLHRVVSTISKLGLPALPRTGFALSMTDAAAVLSVRPALGKQTSDYGRRRDPIRHRRIRFHKGIDFQGKRGDPVFAAGPGVVTRARRFGGYGRVVFIDHGDGLETRYAHLHRVEVNAGDFVPAGVPIGRVGSTGRSTGPHLHFEVRIDGRPVNPERFVDLESGIVERILTAFEHEKAPEKRSKRRTFVPRSRASRALW